MKLEQLMNLLEQHAARYSSCQPCLEVMILDSRRRYDEGPTNYTQKIYPEDIREAVEEYRNLTTKQ